MPRAGISLLLFLALTTPGGFASAAPKPPTREQLFYAHREVELEAQLAKMKLKYTDSHPRIATLQEEINVCKQRTTPKALSQARRGMQTALSTLEQELVIQQDELEHLKLRYAEAHPRLQAAEQSVDNLKREIALRKQK